ncbi:T-complex protein 1 subunit zeta, partial [Globisporangium splendens]
MSFGKTNYRSGGTRGGADRKDLTWYAKTSKEQRALELKQEILLAKQRDEDLMNEALGLAPRRRHEPTGQLDASEMKELLKRGESERDGMDAERVEGLGAAPVIAGVETGPKKTLAERYKETLESGKQDTTFALPGTIDAPNVNGDAAQEKESKEERKARKAAKKQQWKEEKKAKKERKKERKEKKHSGASLSHRSGRKYSSDDDVRRGLKALGLHHGHRREEGRLANARVRALGIEAETELVTHVDLHAAHCVRTLQRVDMIEETRDAARDPDPDRRADIRCRERRWRRFFYVYVLY